MNFIDGYVSDALPLAPSVTPKQGVSQTAAREDHVHPTTVAETILTDYPTKADMAQTVYSRQFTIAVANWADDDAVKKFLWSAFEKPDNATLIDVVFPKTTLDNIQSAGIVIKSWDETGLTLNRPTATTEVLVGRLLWSQPFPH